MLRCWIDNEAVYEVSVDTGGLCAVTLSSPNVWGLRADVISTTTIICEGYQIPFRSQSNISYYLSLYIITDHL